MTLDVAALHRAADRVGTEAGTPAMDAIAAAGAEFLRTSNLHDEFGVAFVVDGPSLGYGIMLGYLAATEGVVEAMREYLAAVDEDDRAATAESEGAKRLARTYLDFAIGEQ